MHKTPFAGLTELDDHDPLLIDGGTFVQSNPSKTDRLLQVGAVSHRHDAHVALGNPLRAPSATLSPTGGSIPAGTTIYVGYTVEDGLGGETRISPVVNATTDLPMNPPSGNLLASGDYSAGSLMIGNYYYGITHLDGAGGETPLGPTVAFARNPGFASAQVHLSGLATELAPPLGPVAWRLWRSQNGQQFQLLASGTGDTFLDNGVQCTDCTVQPPTPAPGGNTTKQTSLLHVTLPTPAQEPVVGSGTAAGGLLRLYLSTDGLFGSPSFYSTYPLSSAGADIQIPFLGVDTGSPPDVSTCIPGANQINPDTDILDWHWKRPVGSRSALPSGSQGDVRLAIDTGIEYGVLAASAFGPNEWTRLTYGPGGSGVAVAGQGGSPFLAARQYLEFVGSGGAVASVQDLGGGSARVLISAGAAGGGGGGSGGSGNPDYAFYHSYTQADETIGGANPNVYGSGNTPTRDLINFTLQGSALLEVGAHLQAYINGTGLKAGAFLDGVQMTNEIGGNYEGTTGSSTPQSLFSTVDSTTFHSTIRANAGLEVASASLMGHPVKQIIGPGAHTVELRYLYANPPAGHVRERHLFVRTTPLGSGGGGGGGAAGPAGAAGAAGASATITIAEPDGTPTLFGRVYADFLGSGGQGVAVQDLGGGSARILIGPKGQTNVLLAKGGAGDQFPSTNASADAVKWNEGGAASAVEWGWGNGSADMNMARVLYVASGRSAAEEAIYDPGVFVSGQKQTSIRQNHNPVLTPAQKASGAAGTAPHPGGGMNDITIAVIQEYGSGAVTRVLQDSLGYSDFKPREVIGSQPLIPPGGLSSLQPYHGQEVYYMPDPVNQPGVRWHLVYNAWSTSPYKWEYVGGSPMYAEVTPDESTVSGTYVDLGTVGPTISLPLGGDYDVEIGCIGYNSLATGGGRMSYDIGATGAVDADCVNFNVWSGTFFNSNVARMRRKLALSAVALTAKYKAGSGTNHFQDRWMRVTPVRVG